jgi:hypothetical protein
MTGVVWLSLWLVQSKLQPHTVKMAGYIVAGQLWECSWKESRLCHHHDVVENSGAHDSVQWCHRFLTHGYSSRSKMLITYIHVVLRLEY